MLGNLKLLEELQQLFGEEQFARLSTLFMQADEQQLQELNKLATEFDWEPYRKPIGKLLADQMQVETLVPDSYADWKPIVHEAVVYIGSRLSIQRLLPKLFEQLILPANTSLEKRLLCFVAQMPSLQKLGQVIARNRNLHPDLKKELLQLENDIHDVAFADIKQQIEQQLTDKLNTGKVKLAKAIFAEATVCALVRFDWFNPQINSKEQGVFKVIKPHIHEHFAEELDLLSGLAEHLDKMPAHVLKEVNLEQTFDEIASVLKQELDTPQEQANLNEAWQRYTEISGMRVPQVIPTLSTDTITAMSFEPGVKVTAAFNNRKMKRSALAEQIVEALIAIPLFSGDEDVLFHADPHAGNLYVDEQTQQLILFDWAMTGRLNADERRKIVLLFLALFLRDKAMLLHTLTGLSQQPKKLSKAKREQIDQTIADFLHALPLYKLPGVNDVLALTDAIMLDGVRFSSGMMLFRKVLLTLDGVLHDISDRVAIENILSQHVMQHCSQELYGMSMAKGLQPDFQLPLSGKDTLSLAMSAQWFYYRTGMQVGERWFKSFTGQ